MKREPFSPLAKTAVAIESALKLMYEAGVALLVMRMIHNTEEPRLLSSKIE